MASESGLASLWPKMSKPQVKRQIHLPGWRGGSSAHSPYTRGKSWGNRSPATRATQSVESNGHGPPALSDDDLERLFADDGDSF